MHKLSAISINNFQLLTELFAIRNGREGFLSARGNLKGGMANTWSASREQHTKSVATTQDVLHIRTWPESELVWIDYFSPNLANTGNRWLNSEQSCGNVVFMGCSAFGVLKCCNKDLLHLSLIYWDVLLIKYTRELKTRYILCFEV